jgi:hypothetical protein
MSTPLTTDDLRAKRDTAIKLKTKIEACMTDIQTAMQKLESDRQILVARLQQVASDLIQTQSMISGFNIALGDEPAQNTVPNGVLVALGLAVPPAAPPQR